MIQYLVTKLYICINAQDGDLQRKIIPTHNINLLPGLQQFGFLRLIFIKI